MAVATLRDIGDERGGGVIMSYEQVLLSKVASSNAQCRRSAFEALLLIIRHDPHKCRHLFAPMLEAIGTGTELLTGKEQEHNITEFTVLFMPHAEQILRKVFDAGNSKGISVAGIVGRTIKLLSLLPSF